MSRPRKPVDERRVIDLASKGLVQEEIAALENISVDTLVRHYADAYKKGTQLRDGSLRRKQYELAMAGNPTMLVWLGKNLLGQTDKLEHQIQRVSFSLGNLPLMDEEQTNASQVPN